MGADGLPVAICQHPPWEPNGGANGLLLQSMASDSPQHSMRRERQCGEVRHKSRTLELVGVLLAQEALDFVNEFRGLGVGRFFCEIQLQLVVTDLVTEQHA